MTQRGSQTTHLAAAALGLVEHRATANELAARFAAAGATLDPGVAGALLDELVSLGLVRMAAGGPAPTYVPTSLGLRALEHGYWNDVAVPLREVERLRTDFLSTVAHELRTPITVMRTLTGLLLDPASDPTPEQRRAMLETMERNAERMQHLIGEILDLARYRAGTIRLQLRQFDAADLVHSAATTIGPLAGQRGQRVIVDLPAGPSPRVFGDRPRLDRALLNLAANAQHFAPDDGHITIGLRTGADGTIRWSVTDDGPGISEADQPHLFERFFVGHQRPREAQEGVGLGLPRALAIAQAHGGSIEVQSSVGRGSTFSLVVPAAGPPEQA